MRMLAPTEGYLDVVEFPPDEHGRPQWVVYLGEEAEEGEQPIARFMGEHAEADARLLSGAHLLVDAVRAMMGDGGTAPNLDRARSIARRALKRVEGRYL